MWNKSEFPRLRLALLLCGTGQLFLLTVALLPLLQPGLEELWQLWLVAGHLFLDLTGAFLLRKRPGLPEEFAFLMPLALLQLLAFLFWQLGGKGFYLAPVLYWLGKAGCLTWLARGTGRILWKLGRSYEAVGGMALWIMYCLSTLLALLRRLELLGSIVGNMVLTAETLIYAVVAAFLLLSMHWIKKGPLSGEE